MDRPLAIVALLAAAGTAVTSFGVVRETVSIAGPVVSVGRQGNPGNTIVTATLTGTWNNGSVATPYTVQQVVFGGTIAGSSLSESSILVTAPDGQRFVISPSRLDEPPVTYSGLITIPVNAISTVAGTWTFEFFDLGDGGGSMGVDSTFTNVTIGFDDATPVTGAIPGTLGNLTLTNVLSDGGVSAGFVTTGFTVSGNSNQVSLIRITGTATALRANPGANAFYNAVNSLRFALVRPDGGVSATASPTFVGIGGAPGISPSSSTFTAFVPLPGLQDINGDWVLRSFQSTDIPGGPDVGMRNIMLSALVPPMAATIPLVDGGAWASATRLLGAGDVRWFTFTTPVFGSGGALDIDVTGTNLSPTNDTSIGLYTASGTLVDSDADDSDGLLSQLSYGSGIRAAVGDGDRFSGQNGSTIGTQGNVGSATQYWLGVTGGNGLYSVGFTPPLTGTNTGVVTARVRAWSSAAPTDPAPPPPVVVDLGDFGAEGGTESVVTSGWTMANAQDVKWFRFSIPANVTGPGTAYLDMDTDLTNPGGPESAGNVNDTHMALWDGLGNLRASDDDDGIDQRSALSFGRTALFRASNVPTPPNAPGLLRGGRDSSGSNATLAAGTYYVSVATFLPQYAFGFAVTPDGLRTSVGDRVFAIRTNFAAPVACVCCNLSNVAGPNQSTTPDDALTADDIIVYLGWYFAGDNRANVAGPNQSTTPDSALTADDIIVFLGWYFAGC
jgi:hypothetical protein